MENKQTYKIILVDDQSIFREGLKLYLEDELGHKVIAEANNGQEFLKLPNISEADFILMDIEMPKMSGLEASKKVLWDYNKLKIIVITMYQDKVYLDGLIELGIKGFVRKSNTFKDLKKVINNVMSDKLYFPIN